MLWILLQISVNYCRIWSSRHNHCSL